MTAPAKKDASGSRAGVRPLKENDFEAVVALDQRTSGSLRRGYFEKRLRSALKHPERHLQLAAASPKGLEGFLLARVAGGEYGQPARRVVLEAVGVDPGLQRQGTGQALVDELKRLARKREAEVLSTQVDWRNPNMLRFLARAGFLLAPVTTLERKVSRMPLPMTDEEIEQAPPLVRHLRADDLKAMTRVDQLNVGEARTDYLQRKVDEALHESALAVSLVVENDGFVVGFATVHVDHGDFGHVEPVASLETLGVDPAFARKGFARALMTQMVDNLAAIHVERLETEVSRDNHEMLRFLYRFGFGPSQRLSFQSPV